MIRMLVLQTLFAIFTTDNQMIIEVIHLLYDINYQQNQP